MTAPMAPAQNAGNRIQAFNFSTRNRLTPLAPTQARTGTGGNINTWIIPATGLVSRIWISILGTMPAPVGAVNAFGHSSIIRRIRLQSNAGYDLFNVTGPGYFYQLAPFIDFPGNGFPQSTGTTVVAAGAINLPVCIPAAVNFRDVSGLLAAQNKETILTLSIEWETDAIVAPGGLGAWVTQPTANVFVELFQVPPNPAARPPLALVHQIIEQQEPVPAAGWYQKTLQTGNVYLQIVMAYGAAAGAGGAGGADNWTNANLVVGHADNIYQYTPAICDVRHPLYRYQARRLGVIPFDFIAQSGMGVYDIARDVLDARNLTDVAINLLTTGAGATLSTVTRQLVPLGAA